ncbi:MAG: dihydropteroate synthase [Clostridiales bacterium]|nr:dihydropteroate synthase [Clostridiales bacterium]
MKIGRKSFDFKNNAYIMGILNLTPDSFSDGGRYNTLDNALKHCEQMALEGADLFDIGAESTRPGHIQISDEEEIERLVPVIRAVKKNFDIPVSVDTYKSAVAKAAVSEGADLINDIWGLKYDREITRVIKEAGVPCVLMHNRGSSDYKSFLADVVSDINESLIIAKAAGIDRDKIIIDPGVGFGKTYEHNLTIIRELDVLKIFDLPILLGTSKKSVIGLTLNIPTDERTLATVATTVFGRMKGASIFRVHDVAENKQALLMTEAIIKNGLN